MGAEALIRLVLRRFGVDVIRHSAAHSIHLRELDLLDALGIACVVDVGANAGQWSKGLRRSGYHGRIVSFEPATEAFIRLEAATRRQPPWFCHHVAIGAENGTAQLNLAANAAASSSLLSIKDRTIEAAPHAAYVGTEQVEIRRLDSFLSDFKPDSAAKLFVKIDTQGFELDVLRGATETLHSTVAAEVELSLVPLYDDQPVLVDVVRHLDSVGFTLTGLENEFHDPKTGQTLQVNGLFVHRDYL